MHNGILVLILCIFGALFGCSDKTNEDSKPAAATSESAKSVVAASEVAKQAAVNITANFEKNGFPCVAEICIGDGLLELQNIHWQLVEEKDIESDTRIEILRDIKLGLKGNFPTQVIPFLVAYKFDATVLPMISGITAVCGIKYGGYLRGNYVSDNGNRTEVGISFMPKSIDSTEQQWTVSRIRRYVETRMNEQDVVAAEHKLGERYTKFVKGINSYGYSGRRDTDASYWFQSSTDSHGQYYFYYDLGIADRQFKMAQMPPQCVNKVNID